MIFELLAIAVVALTLLYLAFFSPKFDRLVKRLFNRQPDNADGIAASVQSAEQQKAQAKQAAADRAKYLADEKAKLDSLNVK